MKIAYNPFKIIVSAIILSLFSCYYDNEQELYPNQFGSTTSTTSTPVDVKYGTDIQPLIATRCASPGCHATSGQFPDLTSHAKLVNNLNRVEVRAIVQKSMPASGPLSSADITKLKSWIDAGAKNN